MVTMMVLRLACLLGRSRRCGRARLPWRARLGRDGGLRSLRGLGHLGRLGLLLQLLGKRRRCSA